MSRPKLLLADDSVTIRKVVELTFADEGIDVTAVPDADAAMQRFVELQPDIVLVDVTLDGTSGYQICEMIKADDATSHIPVLLLVGSFEPFDQDEAERVGADGFLTKPFHSIRDLVARVKDLLDRETPPDPVPVESAQTFTNGGSAPDPSVEESITERSLAEAVAPDTTDIDNLYLSSFAETVEIDQYDTLDDLMDEGSFDDEMIEASSPNVYAPAVDAPDEVESVGAAASQSPGSEMEMAETTSETKEFDWSPDSLVSAPVEERSIEVAEPALSDASVDIPVDVPAGVSPFEEVAEGHEEVLPTESESQPEASAEAEVSESVTPESHSEPAEEVRAADVSGETMWPGDTAVHDEGVQVETPASAEISEEWIDLIVTKVVERMSDRVIREVALETVPSVAEKLIREALETSGRKEG